MVGAVSPDVVQGVLERLLASPSISYRDRNRLAWGEDLATGRRLDLETLYPAFAAKLAYQRRVRLALAVAILCDGVAGPGAARLARWRDIDLAGRRWTVYLAHGAPGRKSRRGRMASVAVELPPRAVEASEEARALRDGLRLLLDLVHPEQYSPAEARRTFQYPGVRRRRDRVHWSSPAARPASPSPSMPSGICSGRWGSPSAPALCAKRGALLSAP